MENLGVLTSRHQTDSDCKSRFVPWRYSTSQNHKNFKCGAETLLRVDFRMMSAVEQMWGELTQESKLCLEGSQYLVSRVPFHREGPSQKDLRREDFPVAALLHPAVLYVCTLWKNTQLMFGKSFTVLFGVLQETSCNIQTKTQNLGINTQIESFINYCCCQRLFT